MGFHPHGEIEKNRYDSEFTVSSEEGKYIYSIFPNPAADNSVCLYVKPRLGFFAALIGKSDALREKATTAAHGILSHAEHVEELGWFTERQVWRSSTSVP